MAKVFAPQVRRWLVVLQLLLVPCYIQLQWIVDAPHAACSNVQRET